ncbi:MAG: VTT domain-containing protein [Bryobacteraceae bacterium]
MYFTPVRLWQLLLIVLAVILVPFFIWEHSIEDLATRLFASGVSKPLLGVAIAALLASDLLLPVPSSIASTAAAALLGFWGGLASSFFGMTAGCLLGYWLGTRLPAERFLTPNDFARLEKGQARFGDWMVVVFRAVPVLAEASVFFAGLGKRPFARFFTLTALSNLGISAVYAAAGAFSAQRETFLFAFFGAIALPGLAMLLLGRK